MWRSLLREEEQRLLATFTSDLDKIQVATEVARLSMGQETRAKIEEVSSMVGLFATKAAIKQGLGQSKVAEQTEQTVWSSGVTSLCDRDKAEALSDLRVCASAFRKSAWISRSKVGSPAP